MPTSATGHFRFFAGPGEWTAAHAGAEERPGRQQGHRRDRRRGRGRGRALTRLTTRPGPRPRTAAVRGREPCRARHLGRLSRVMSGPEYPDAPPPEVPEEFAAAYRDAYRRALEPERRSERAGPARGARRSEVRARRRPIGPRTRAPTRARPRAGAPSAVVPAGRRSPPSPLVLVSAAYAVGTVALRRRRATGRAARLARRPTGQPARRPVASASKPTDAEPSTSPGGWDGAGHAGGGRRDRGRLHRATEQRLGRSPGHLRRRRTPSTARSETRLALPGRAIGQTLTLRLRRRGRRRRGRPDPRATPRPMPRAARTGTPRTTGSPGCAGPSATA